MRNVAGDPDAWPIDVAIPDDSDPNHAGIFGIGYEGLLDRTAYSKKRTGIERVIAKFNLSQTGTLTTSNVFSRILLGTTTGLLLNDEVDVVLQVQAALSSSTGGEMQLVYSEDSNDPATGTWVPLPAPASHFGADAFAFGTFWPLAFASRFTKLSSASGGLTSIGLELRVTAASGAPQLSIPINSCVGLARVWRAT